MKKEDILEKSYQHLIDWNLYRLEQNKNSLDELMKLLPKLDRSQPADPIYEKDIDDLESLKILYETSLRNFEGQITKYRDLLNEI